MSERERVLSLNKQPHQRNQCSCVGTSPANLHFLCLLQHMRLRSINSKHQNVSQGQIFFSVFFFFTFYKTIKTTTPPTTTTTKKHKTTKQQKPQQQSGVCIPCRYERIWFTKRMYVILNIQVFAMQDGWLATWKWPSSQIYKLYATCMDKKAVHEHCSKS